jgi:hypothetical protein
MLELFWNALLSFNLPLRPAAPTVSTLDGCSAQLTFRAWNLLLSTLKLAEN